MSNEHLDIASRETYVDASVVPAAMSKEASKLVCSCGKRTWAQPVWLRCKPSDVFAPTEAMRIVNGSDDERARLMVMPVIASTDSSDGIALHVECDMPRRPGEQMEADGVAADDESGAKKRPRDEQGASSTSEEPAPPAPPKETQKCPFCPHVFSVLVHPTITRNGQKLPNPARHNHGFLNHTCSMDLHTGCQGPGHPKRKPATKPNRTRGRSQEAAESAWPDAYAAAKAIICSELACSFCEPLRDLDLQPPAVLTVGKDPSLWTSAGFSEAQG